MVVWGTGDGLRRAFCRKQTFLKWLKDCKIEHRKLRTAAALGLRVQGLEPAQLAWKHYGKSPLEGQGIALVTAMILHVLSKLAGLGNSCQVSSLATARICSARGIIWPQAWPSPESFHGPVPSAPQHFGGEGCELGVLGWCVWARCLGSRVWVSGMGPFRTSSIHTQEYLLTPPSPTCCGPGGADHEPDGMYTKYVLQAWGHYHIRSMAYESTT